MKTCLKRSEIISQLHLILHDESSIKIVKESILDCARVEKYYILLIQRKDFYQVVSIHLIYGWTEFEIRESNDLVLAQCAYIDRIRECANDIF